MILFEPTEFSFYFLKIVITLSLILLCLLAKKYIFPQKTLFDKKESSPSSSNLKQNVEADSYLESFERNGFIKIDSSRENAQNDFKLFKDELHSQKNFMRKYPEAKGIVYKQDGINGAVIMSVCDPQLIEEIMIDKDKYYLRNLHLSYAASILSNSFLFNSDHLKLKRKIYVQIFHFGLFQEHCEALMKIAKNHIIMNHSVKVETKLIFSLEEIFGEWSLYLFFGKSASSSPKLVSSLQNFYNNIRSAIVLLNPKRMKQFINPFKEVLQEFFLKTIADIKQDENYKQHPQNNITWHLLTNEEIKLEGETLNQICEDIAIFFFAGRDTVVNTLQMAIYYICKHKEYYHHIQNEITSLNGQFRMQALSNMKYLEAALKETLRIYGPTTNILPKVATEDHSLLGGKIPIQKGTILNLAIQELHYNPKYYPEPDRFYPERWFNQELKSQEKKVFMAFSIGTHKCIGDKLAYPIMKMMIILLMSNYQIKIDEGYLLELVAFIQYGPKDAIPFELTPLSSNQEKQKNSDGNQNEIK